MSKHDQQPEKDILQYFSEEDRANVIDCMNQIEEIVSGNGTNGLVALRLIHNKIERDVNAVYPSDASIHYLKHKARDAEIIVCYDINGRMLGITPAYLVK